MHGLDSDLALSLVRVTVGLIVAAHGAQKVFGVFGGPGLAKFQGMVASQGFAQPRVFATLAAFTELFGGLALAIGLYTPMVAAMLCLDMLVAVFKVHAPKGFFNQGGGYEYPLALALVFAAVGLNGATRYSLDAALGIVAGAAWFVLVFVVGGLITVAASATGVSAAAQRTAPR